ncbi:Pkinase-domain-containing protein [Trametopsis cervina]|nr:Pkinase-domain-containing protein [Trametopsis cervina]
MTVFSSILPNLTGYTLCSTVIRLQFLRQIGTGAYGLVYLAQDLLSQPSNPMFYAVKCMLKFEAGSDLEALQKREIALHKSMTSHPHITTLHAVIEEEHYVYMIMDYYEGGDLFAAIIDRQSFSRNDGMVKLGFVQLLDAVQACHDQEIFHRDLKPENVLCSSADGKLYLSDFGLATNSVATSSFGCGSSFYMSPECIGSSNRLPYATRSSDVWSLGVILVNMLSGRNPWRIASLQDEGYAMYLGNGPHFLHQILPMISTEAIDILLRIFDPHPPTRISIPELRSSVLNTTSFFAPENEDAEAMRLLTETFPEPTAAPQGEASLDITFDMGSSQDSSRTTAFVSINIRTPAIELAHSGYFNGSDASSQQSEENDGPGPNAFVSQSIRYSHPALDAERPAERTTVQSSLGKRARRSGSREMRVPRTVHRLVEVIHKITRMSHHLSGSH